MVGTKISLPTHQTALVPTNPPQQTNQQSSSANSDKSDSSLLSTLPTFHLAPNWTRILLFDPSEKKTFEDVKLQYAAIAPLHTSNSSRILLLSLGRHDELRQVTRDMIDAFLAEHSEVVFHELVVCQIVALRLTTLFQPITLLTSPPTPTPWWRIFDSPGPELEEGADGEIRLPQSPIPSEDSSSSSCIAPLPPSKEDSNPDHYSIQMIETFNTNRSKRTFSDPHHRLQYQSHSSSSVSSHPHHLRSQSPEDREVMELVIKIRPTRTVPPLHHDSDDGDDEEELLQFPQPLSSQLADTCDRDTKLITPMPISPTNIHSRVPSRPSLCSSVSTTPSPFKNSRHPSPSSQIARRVRTASNATSGRHTPNDINIHYESILSHPPLVTNGGLYPSHNFSLFSNIATSSPSSRPQHLRSVDDSFDRSIGRMNGGFYSGSHSSHGKSDYRFVPSERLNAVQSSPTSPLHSPPSSAFRHASESPFTRFIGHTNSIHSATSQSSHHHTNKRPTLDDVVTRVHSLVSTTGERLTATCSIESCGCIDSIHQILIQNDSTTDHSDSTKSSQVAIKIDFNPQHIPHVFIGSHPSFPPLPVQHQTDSITPPVSSLTAFVMTKGLPITSVSLFGSTRKRLHSAAPSSCPSLCLTLLTILTVIFVLLVILPTIFQLQNLFDPSDNHASGMVVLEKERGGLRQGGLMNPVTSPDT